MGIDTTLETRIAEVRSKLSVASEGKYPVPRLIAVTKTHPVEMIQPLKALGITEIGENRVQEIQQKQPVLQDAFRIHLIGRLQTNKVKYIADTIHMIQSLDRMDLAKEIDRRAVSAGRSIPVLVQVSPAGEVQKGGLPPEAVDGFIREIRHMDGLSVRGLMAVMPNTPDQAYLHGLFADMRTLFERLRDAAPQGVDIAELSMGMSGDYLLAAAHGATMVRVGSAIFGPRDYGTQK